MVKQGPLPGAVKNKNGSHPGAGKKAMRRVEQARASYARAEDRVTALRLRLARAEEKLTRRAARLSAAEESLAALAVAPGLDASGPPEEANEVAAVVAQNEVAAVVAQNEVAAVVAQNEVAVVVAQEDQADPATGGPVADTLMAPAAHEASSPHGATTPADVVATEPAATAQSSAHGAGARRSRSRRKPSSQGES